MKALAAIAVSLLASCVSYYTPTAEYDPAEYLPYQTDGEGVIEGQLYVTIDAGEVILGGNREVTLKPATSYSSEWFEMTAKKGRKPGRRHELQGEECTWVALTTPEGRFRFEGLPPGRYYLAGEVWRLQAGVGVVFKFGGRATAEVEVGSEPVQVDLTN